MTILRAGILLFAMAVSTAAAAAGRVRLVYGKGWDRAGEAVLSTLRSASFAHEIAGRYVIEAVDDGKENPGTHRLPAIFAIDEKGRIFCVIENVPFNAPGEAIANRIAKAAKVRDEAIAGGLDTPDKCGEMLLAMEKFVGNTERWTNARVIGDSYFGDVFAKLKQLDPNDATGWQLRFTIGNGENYVIEANACREKNEMSEGAGKIEQWRKLPRKHLTLEQKQAILMASFALYREDSSKRDEMIKLLQRIAAADENTFWGTAALGWLNKWGCAPISLYWGWHKGDLEPHFKKSIKYGMQYFFRKPGEYEIKLEAKNGGSANIENVTLKAGDEVVAELKKAPFEVKIDRQHAGKLTEMILVGSTTIGSEGEIKVIRKVLKPRKVGR